MHDLNRYDYVVKAFNSLKLEDATFWHIHLNMVTKSLLKMVNYYFLIWASGAMELVGLSRYEMLKL